MKKKYYLEVTNSHFYSPDGPPVFKEKDGGETISMDRIGVFQKDSVAKEAIKQYGVLNFATYRRTLNFMLKECYKDAKKKLEKDKSNA